MSEVRVVALSPAATSATAWPDRGVRIHPIALLHVAILALVVSNLGRIPFLDLGSRQAPLLIGDLATGLAFTGWLLWAMAAQTLRVDRVALAALLFASVGGVSAIAAAPRFGLSAFEVVASLAYLARWLLYFGLYLIIVNIARPRHVPALWRTLETAMLLFAAFGVLQSIFLPNFALMVYPDQANAWDAQRHRLVSTVLDPNLAAAMMLTVLLVQLSLIASGGHVARWKPALLTLATLMTLSRSGILALAIGVGVIVVARGVSRRLARFGLVLLIGFLAGLPRLLAFAADYDRLSVSDGSALSRLIVWERALATFLESPWIGVGFNTYGFVQEQRGIERLNAASYSAEGGLLFIAVMTGILGLSVFLVMLWLMLRQCRRGWRDAAATPSERGLCIGAAAVTVAICVHSIFVNTLLVPFVMLPLWVLWGLVSVSRARMRKDAAVVA